MKYALIAAALLFAAPAAANDEDEYAYAKRQAQQNAQSTQERLKAIDEAAQAGQRGDALERKRALEWDLDQQATHGGLIPRF